MGSGENIVTIVTINTFQPQPQPQRKPKPMIKILFTIFGLPAVFFGMAQLTYVQSAMQETAAHLTITNGLLCILIAAVLEVATQTAKRRK